MHEETELMSVAMKLSLDDEGRVRMQYEFKRQANVRMEEVGLFLLYLRETERAVEEAFQAHLEELRKQSQVSLG